MTIDSVTGFKSVNGSIEEMNSDAEAAENADQGDPDTSFDVPTSGFGYYLVFKQDGGFKYSGNRTLKFAEFEGENVNPTRVFVSTVTIAAADQFQIRQYGFNSTTHKTINEALNIREFFDARAAFVDGSTTDIKVTTPGTYKVWLDYAKLNLGFETASPLLPEFADQQEQIATLQTEPEIVSPVKQKMPGHGPKRSDPGAQDYSSSTDGTDSLVLRILADNNSGFSDLNARTMIKIYWNGEGSKPEYWSYASDWMDKATNYNWNVINLNESGTWYYYQEVKIARRSWLKNDQSNANNRVEIHRMGNDGSDDWGSFTASINKAGVLETLPSGGSSNSLYFGSARGDLWFNAQNKGYIYKIRTYKKTSIDGSWVKNSCEVYDSSHSYTLPTPTAPTGYTFAGWYSDSTLETFVGNAGATHTPSADISLYAKYTPTSYTLSYTLNGGSVATDNPTSYTITSSAITLNNPTRDGYTFKGWSGTGLAGDSNTTVTIAAGSTGDRSFTANWTANQYDVSFYANYPNDATSTSTKIETKEDQTFGGKYSLPSSNPTFSGWTFIEWNTADDGSGTTVTSSTDIAIADDHNVYAIWEQCWTITFKDNGGGSSDIVRYVPQPSGSLTTLTAAASGFSLSGYTLSGWNTAANGSGSSYSTNTSYTFTADTTLYAVYTKTVTLDNQDGSGTTSFTATYNKTPSNLTPPTRANYTFGGYCTSSGGAGTPIFNNLGVASSAWTSSVGKLYAKWTRTVSLNGYSSYGGSQNVSLVWNAVAPSSITAPSRTGYDFDGYYSKDGTSTGDWGSQIFNSSGNPTSNVWNVNDGYLYAKWTIIDYTISYKDQGDAAFSGTHASGYPTIYHYGTGATLLTATKTGYTFGGWFDNSSCTGSAVTSIANNVTGNKTFYAKWTAHTYTVTFDKNNSFATGTMSDQTGFSYDTGKALSSNGFSLNNYTFLGWSKDSDDTQARYSNQQSVTDLTAVDGDSVTLYAIWKLKPGYYIIGTGISTNGTDYNDNWNDYPLMIAADTTIHDSTNNKASWADAVVYFKSDYSAYSESARGFKIIYVTSTGTSTSFSINWDPESNNQPEISSGSSSWFSGEVNQKNRMCTSAGSYTVYYSKNDNKLYFTKQIVITLDAKGETAGTNTQIITTSGASFSALTSAYLPTSSDYHFGGFWACSDAGETFTKIYFDYAGNVINDNNFTENTTLYARWYTDAQCYYAGETYYLIPNSRWRSGNAEFAAYFFTDSSGNKVTRWVEMSQIGNSGVYTLTLSSGVYERVIFARMDKGCGGSTDWEDRLAQTEDLSKTAGKYYYKIDAGNNEEAIEPPATGSWITVVPYYGGETLYLLPDTNWKDSNAGFAVYLFGGSAETWLTLTRVVDEDGGVSDYWSVTLTGTALTKQWAGAIFTRYNTGAGAPSWSNCWNQTDNLYRTLSTQVCYEITNSVSSPADGDWHEFTSRAAGYYLVGDSETSESSFYNMDWRLDEDGSHTIAAGTVAIAADNDTVSGNKANWTGIVIKNDDVFKIVRVVGKIPYYYGYYTGGSQNLTGFLNTSQDSNANLLAIKDCTATVFFNNDYHPFVSVTQFATTASVATYSSLTHEATSVTTSAASFAITVTIADTTVTAINAASPATAQYCELSLYSKTSAWNASTAIGQTISAASQVFYAIYIRNHVTVTINGANNSTDLGTLHTIEYDMDASGGATTYDLGSTVKTYGNATTGELAAYDKDGNKTQLYTNIGCTSAYGGALTANITVYLPVTKRASKTIYVEAAYSSYTEDSEAGLWTQIHITQTNGVDYFASTEDSAWRVSVNLYRIIVPTSWDFRIGNGMSSGGTGHNFTEIINLDDSGTSTYLFIQAWQNANHPVVLCTEKAPVGEGTATIYKNNVSFATMSYADWATNYFIYESGLPVKEGDTIHVVVSGVTGSDAGINGTYKRSKINGNPGWFIKGTANADSEYSFKINGGDSYTMQVNPSNENEVMAVGVNLVAGQTLTFFHNGEAFAFTAKPGTGNKYSSSAIETGLFDFYLDITKNTENLWVGVNDHPEAIELIANVDVNLNLYIFNDHGNFYLSVAAVPSLGNGYYLMKTADNGGTTSGYRNGVKMISDATGASYGHYYALEGDNIYARSYLHSEETSMTVVSKSADGVGTAATANTANGYIHINITGYYSLVVVDNTLFIYGYDSSSFFKLNELDLNADASTIYEQQTALVLEVEFTIENNAPVNLSLKVNNGLSTFVGCRLVVSDTKIASSVYGTIRGDESGYLSRLSNTPTVAGSGTLSTMASRGSSTGYAYILVDYINTNLDVTAYGQALSFTLVATQA